MNNNGKRQNCDNKNHDGDGDDESETYLELLKFCLVKWGPSISTNCTKKLWDGIINEVKNLLL